MTRHQIGRSGVEVELVEGYRYGFNGKENDNEVKGEGNQQDYGMRVYDPRIAKFLSVDPITAKYPMLTPYQFASNRPIDGIDLDGLEYATYKIKINGLSGAIMSSEVIWNNPNQHNEFGSRGKGVLYKISVWDSWFKTYRSEDVELMIHRNATMAGLKTEYGHYMGATSLYTLDKKGNFTGNYDYSLSPVDAVDNFAYQHDKGYDNLNAVGASGLLSDWGTTPVDEAALNGWRGFLQNYKVGDGDPFNGQKVTGSERSAAENGALSFKIIVDDKKSHISEFMRENYYSQTYNNTPRMSRTQYKKSVEYNYQLFLKMYMNKDSKGNWERKEDMWTRDANGNYTPNKPKKG